MAFPAGEFDTLGTHWSIPLWWHSSSSIYRSGRYAHLMRKRIARRTATAVMLVSATTLATGSQAATAFAEPCTEVRMEVGTDVEASAIMILVGDDSGRVIRDYSVRMETTATKKYVVFSYSTGSGVCRS